MILSSIIPSGLSRGAGSHSETFFERADTSSGLVLFTFTLPGFQKVDLGRHWYFTSGWLAARGCRYSTGLIDRAVDVVKNRSTFAVDREGDLLHSVWSLLKADDLTIEQLT